MPRQPILSALGSFSPHGRGLTAFGALILVFALLWTLVNRRQVGQAPMKCPRASASSNLAQTGLSPPPRRPWPIRDMTTGDRIDCSGKGPSSGARPRRTAGPCALSGMPFLSILCSLRHARQGNQAIHLCSGTCASAGGSSSIVSMRWRFPPAVSAIWSPCLCVCAFVSLCPCPFLHIDSSTLALS
ncbi:hypothetical protein V8C34DRAFT_265667 [Trichoderma compactum]